MAQAVDWRSLRRWEARDIADRTGDRKQMRSLGFRRLAMISQMNMHTVGMLSSKSFDAIYLRRHIKKSTPKLPRDIPKRAEPIRLRQAQNLPNGPSTTIASGPRFFAIY